MASPSGSPSSRPSTSSRCASASSPASPGSTSSSELDEAARADLRAGGHPRRRRPPADGHQGRAARDQGAVRHAPGGRGHARRGRDDRPGPRRRQGAGRRHDRGRLRQDGRGRRLQDPGPRWPRRGRGQAQERRPRQPRHLHDRPRLPAVLLQPGQGVPAAGAWTSPSASARPRACRSSTCCRWQPDETIQAIIDTRDVRRRALPVLRHPRGHGEEDGVHRVRLRPARRAHRPQPARRRRAGAGHRDDGRRRHLHGQPQGHDHPLQRGRGAAHGSRRGRRAGHEAEAPATRSCRSTSPGTTSPSSSSPRPATASAPSSTGSTVRAAVARA